MGHNPDDFFGRDPFESDSFDEPSPDDLPPMPAVEGSGVAPSLLDVTLDAVQGVRRRVPTKTCPSCGSKEVRQRSEGFGGSVTLYCLKCRVEVPWASVPRVDILPMPNRISAGPFYRSGPSFHPNPADPIFRQVAVKTEETK